MSIVFFLVRDELLLRYQPSQEGARLKQLCTAQPLYPVWKAQRRSRRRQEKWPYHQKRPPISILAVGLRARAPAQKI